MSILLSPAQRGVVEAPDHHYLVVASAGSGKTRVLTERVRYLLETKKIRSQVMALTFTNKAADEMRRRLQDLPDLSERTYLGTIHSFCQSIIETHGKVIGFEAPTTIIERESDRIAMLEEVFTESADLKHFLERQDSPKTRRKFLYEVLEKFSACKRDWESFEAITSGDWPNKTEVRAFREYQKHLASQRVIDFDDILLLAYRILTERPAVANIYQRTYRHICVDEAQDLNAVQYALIRTLGEKAESVLLVGDPNQAIYGFNGSSKRFMLEKFPEDFGAKQLELRENFRSSRAVIQAASALYEGSIDLDNVALDGELVLEPCVDEETEAGWVADKVRALLATGSHPEIDGPITLDRIAVLARNRYVFGPLQGHLTEAGIDFYLRQPGGGASLESDLGQVFDLGIRLLVNPRNRLHAREFVRRLGSACKPDSRSQEPLALLKSACDTASESWKNRTPALLEAWSILQSDVNKFSSAIGTIEESVTAIAMEETHDTEERALAIADLGFLRAVWRNYSQRVAKGHRSLGQFRNQMATGETVPNVEGKGLTLATVHAMKGLEFDIVFIMGLVEGGFPDYRAVKAGGTALAEEKNDCFVAITRAKRLLYLTWPKTKYMPWDKENRVAQRKSRFVEDIEKNGI